MKVLGKNFRQTSQNSWARGNITIITTGNGRYCAWVEVSLSMSGSGDTPADAIRALRKRAEEVVAALKEFEV